MSSCQLKILGKFQGRWDQIKPYLPISYSGAFPSASPSLQSLLESWGAAEGSHSSKVLEDRLDQAHMYVYMCVKSLLLWKFLSRVFLCSTHCWIPPPMRLCPEDQRRQTYSLHLLCFRGLDCGLESGRRILEKSPLPSLEE